ncbi:PREDICTED: transmembrane protein 165-like isoform X2 [Priapulus caudatus]|uniref:GDT1 family protein n=1 Tax=Priapulus caudatus TaxID=37621 RepID=A0ABM1EDZ0_PRICU|nr:PREDICTED: transmembrane protein 165-like isoform X2 [Priapulus caudatus]
MFERKEAAKLCTPAVGMSMVLLLLITATQADENEIADKSHDVKDLTEALHVKPVDEMVNEQMKSDLGFTHSFVATVSMIIVSELGDKTFFIAAIMAMRHARLVVFAGAISALVIMTVLSALLGFATTIIPRTYTYYASAILFAIFGLQMLKQGWYMSPDEAAEEMDEVQADIKRKEDELLQNEQPQRDVESGAVLRRVRRRLCPCLSYVFVESLTLTFLAEWGDRSQLATIVLAARENIVGVILGGSFGHSLCTGLAVLGGKFIASKISVKTVTLIGGAVFMLFAISSLFLDPES